MKPTFFAFLFERPQAERPWSPLEHPGLFQVAYRSGALSRIQQCACVDDPDEEMRAWARQTQALGLTPFLVMLNNGSPFAHAWRTDAFLGTLLMGSVEVDLVLLEDILIYPEDEWLTRHLAMCGHQVSRRLESSELPPLDLLIPFSLVYRQWRESLDPECEEDAVWREADPSRIETMKGDWLPVRQGGRTLLLNALCPLAFVEIKRDRNTATLTADGILTRLPAIHGVIPAKVDSPELEVDVQTLSAWLEDKAQAGKPSWLPAWLKAGWIHSSGLGFGYQLAGFALIVLQAGAIAYLLAVPPESPYSEIRSPAPNSSADGPFILVGFTPQSRESEIRALLVSLGASIVAGPSQLGDYFLMIDGAQTDMAFRQLQQSPLVQSVAIVAQLPPAKD